LTSPPLIAYLREKDFIVWAGDVKEAEAYQGAS